MQTDWDINKKLIYDNQEDYANYFTVNILY